MMLKVIDNFLDQPELKQIQSEILSNEFPWFLNDHSDKKYDGNAQFCHTAYFNNVPHSQYFHTLQPIYDKLQAFSIYKVRLIGTFKKENENENQYHQDVSPYLSSKPIKTAVFYLNDNDGGTQFKHTGEIVQSKTNRIAIFDSNLEHRTVKHTTGFSLRCVVNINYIER